MPDYPARPVLIEVHAEVVLDVADIWPDGDAPNPVTADAVKAVMEAAGMRPKDWGLLEDIDVTVSVPNPHWSPDPPLLPDHAPDRFDTAEVWADA